MTNRQTQSSESLGDLAPNMLSEAKFIGGD
jgi:hypothetical protein